MGVNMPVSFNRHKCLLHVQTRLLKAQSECSTIAVGVIDIIYSDRIKWIHECMAVVAMCLKAAHTLHNHTIYNNELN